MNIKIYTGILLHTCDILINEVVWACMCAYVICTYAYSVHWLPCVTCLCPSHQAKIKVFKWHGMGQHSAGKSGEKKHRNRLTDLRLPWLDNMAWYLGIEKFMYSFNNLQCLSQVQYGLQITVNGLLRPPLTSSRQGHEETGRLIVSDCFIQLISFLYSINFISLRFFNRTLNCISLLLAIFCATGLQSRHGASGQLDSNDWRNRSVRSTRAEATNEMFAVTQLEYNRMYCHVLPICTSAWRQTQVSIIWNGFQSKLDLKTHVQTGNQTRSERLWKKGCCTGKKKKS